MSGKLKMLEFLFLDESKGFFSRNPSKQFVIIVGDVGLQFWSLSDPKTQLTSQLHSSAFCEIFLAMYLNHPPDSALEQDRHTSSSRLIPNTSS